eukprot:Selendium_serpulae@DN6105_c1_g1_i1.p2
MVAINLLTEGGEQRLSCAVVAVDKKERRKGFRELSRVVSSANLQPSQYNKIWHILLKCYWLCDKHIFQTELAVQMSLLTRWVAAERYMDFVVAFYGAVSDIWHSLDAARIPKYERLLRIFQTEIFHRLGSSQRWSHEAIAELNKRMLEGGPFSTKNVHPGITLCLLDPFVEELKLATDANATRWNSLKLLHIASPILRLVRLSENGAVAKKALDQIFKFTLQRDLKCNLSSVEWLRIVFEIAARPDKLCSWQEMQNIVSVREALKSFQEDQGIDVTFEDVLQKVQKLQSEGTALPVEDQIDAERTTSEEFTSFCATQEQPESTATMQQQPDPSPVCESFSSPVNESFSSPVCESFSSPVCETFEVERNEVAVGNLSLESAEPAARGSVPVPKEDKNDSQMLSNGKRKREEGSSAGKRQKDGATIVGQKDG